MNAAQKNSAWKRSPREYHDTRRADFSLPAKPYSLYVTMRDGCRLAVDVYLPRSSASAEVPGEFPTLVFFTPYYRRFKLVDGSSAECNPNTGKFRDYLVPRGYAVVVVDVRGTGASFGTRDGFRSPSERLDSAEIAEWIVTQKWSNGKIGATGISYLGAAADFLASTGHPAVKAIAPLFSVWDTYSDNYFPGGLNVRSLTRLYDEIMLGLDQDRRDVLKKFAYFSNPDFDGPQPVDDDASGELVRQALKEHEGNFRQTEFMADLRFREEGLPYDPSYSTAAFSPYSYAHNVRPDVAVLSVSGWYDGAGYANGAIARFLTLKDNPRHLLLGPWDHGARIDVSPWRTSVETDFPLLAEITRFFDCYLMGLENTGLPDEAPVHYFSMHAQEWRAAEAWPVTSRTQDYYPAGEAHLGAAPSAGTDIYQVDYSTGTGQQTRYERIAGLDTRHYYEDWQGRTARMLSYETAPLHDDLEIVGHALVQLDLALSTPDAAIFLYLTEVEADGAERYVTEGLLRALHRQEAHAPENCRISWPFRTFRREDARPVEPGTRETYRIPLLPVAWRFKKESRIRLSVAGSDSDHFGLVPHGRPPAFTLARQGSRLSLPFVTGNSIASEECMPDADFSAVMARMKELADFSAMTVLAYSPAEEKAHRVFSSLPEVFSADRQKAFADAPVMRAVRDRMTPILVEGEAGLRQSFRDADHILDSGCSAVLNIPMMRGKEILGQINLMGQSGAFAAETFTSLMNIAADAAGILSGRAGQRRRP